MSYKKLKRILPKADSSPHHTSKMEVPLKNFNGFKLLNIFTRFPHLRCVTGLEFASDFNK